MANEKNLRPSEYKLSQEEAKKGGINSGKVRREKRTMKELLELVLSQEITNKKGETATKKEVMAVQLANKAVNGDLKAIDQVTKLLGEQIQKTEVTGADGKPLIPEDTRTQEEKEAEIARLLNKGE